MPYRPCTELLCVEIYSLTVGESVIILNDEAIRNLGLITLLVCADTLPELVKELTLVVTSPGGGGTPIHYLYGYVPPKGVVILKLLI